ncbi:MAG TPA: cellulase family glycosylhydrolase, partial [Gaiellaceae bacterium]
TWSGSPTSYGYSWRRCDSTGANCAAISGATGASYTLTSSDVNYTERVIVTATNTAGSGNATSAQSAVVKAASSPSTPPPAGSYSRFGSSSGWQLPWLSSTDRTTYLDSAKGMGVKIERFDIDWGAIQNGGPSSYNWSAQDAIVQALNARGIATLGTIAYTPAWARPSTCNTSDKCVPANNADYGNFCGAVARHYLPMGVHAWEVWNEPNLTAFFQPKPDVAKYTGMLKACYTQIKAVDPSATVVTGGTSPAGSYNAPCSSACSNVNGINWLEGIYANGGKGYFDAVGHHPYSFPSDPSTAAGWSAWYQMFGTTPSLRSLMVANGDGAKQIWGTEWGVPTNGPSGSGFVSETTQAAQVTSAYTLWKSYSWAGPLFTYTFRDAGTSTSTRENFFGLVRNDWSHKPSYAAYQSAAAAG